MRVVSSPSRRISAAQIAALLGTSSFLTIAGTGAALAAAAPAANGPVEQVLITGSLIQGAPAVGVPVTAVGAQDFKETGAITTSQLMETIPSVSVRTDVSPLIGGGSTDWSQNVAVHGITGSGGDVATLMLVDGKRWPVQGHGGDTVDPSIVPSIATQRVDILTSGASAVYGADAVTGVINVILKRGYDGAQTQVTISRSQDIGGPPKIDFQQIWGRSWDSGNVTISLEASKQSRIKATARNYFTQNYEPWGLYNAATIGDSLPAVVSVGTPYYDGSLPGVTMTGGLSANTSRRYCANCYDLPHGVGWNYGTQAPGPTTNWSTIQSGQWTVGKANDNNYHDMWANADIQPSQNVGAAVITVDQQLTDDFVGLGPVSFYATGFWYSRKSVAHYPDTPNSGNSREHVSLHKPDGIEVSTNNPYYPAGAPTDLHVFYQFSQDLGGGSRISGNNGATRGEFGFNFDGLPFNWTGKMYYSYTDDKNYAHTTNMIASGNAFAALNGSYTHHGTGDLGTVTVTKPASVPYLNVFCDATVYQCNSKATLDYITGFRNQDEEWKDRQVGFNFQGPIFDLPAGQVKLAIAGEDVSQHYYFHDYGTARGSGQIKSVPNDQFNVGIRSNWAVFGQLNIPLVGGDFTAPFFQKIDVQLGYRIDKYKALDFYIKTPKIAANWTLGYGFTLRAAWGKAFRQPDFGQTSSASGSRANGYTQAVTSNDQVFGCLGSYITGGGTALPGSATYLLNPSCSHTALAEYPGGIDLQGGSGLADPARGISLTRADGNVGPPKGLQPEKSKQWTVGAHFQPTDGPLVGLNMDWDYYHILVNGTIQANTVGNSNPDNPASASQYLIITDPSKPITDPANAAFYQVVQNILAGPSVEIGGDFNALDVKWIHDSADANLGSILYTGSDFSARYDWDMGDLGTWNAGVTGFYEFDQKTVAYPGAAPSYKYKGQNSGSHMNKMRYRLGWTNGTWSVTGFANYYPHRPQTGNNRLPDCYFAQGYSTGSCYPGSPYYPQPYPFFFDGAPAFYTFDLNFQYNTGQMPASEYLQNLNISLTVNNLLNRTPTFMYSSRSRGREARAFDDRWSMYQREFTLTITKTW